MNLDLSAFTAALDGDHGAMASAWEPWIVAIAPGEFRILEALCADRRIAMFDTIDLQLADLARVRHPHVDEEAERRRFVGHVWSGQGNLSAYGRWVFFPWEWKLVHLLPPDDYFDVITSRNQDKITHDEQRQLRGKRIGVVGLSVGGEAAVTVAQEHLCGTIVLADFDGLDLSNLNRLNAGVDDLGCNKASIVARRIAKINPYLDIVVFEDGVTEDNLDRFIDGLDLLIEECDGLEMKYRLRMEAKARGINIVFAADELGFLSVEPHAFEPDLAPFHGRIARAQSARDDYATEGEFWQALSVWLGGWDRISERSRQSVLRIGETLCGYPQLASEARYAAGQLGHVARRLLLGERLRPFAGHLGVERYLPSPAS